MDTDALNAEEPIWAALALLWPAMLLGEDIEISGAISGRLLFALQNDIQALLTTYEPRLQTIKIMAEEKSHQATLHNQDAVATGFSAGIDSFATLSLFGAGPESLRPTHLTVFNVGALQDTAKARPLFQRYVERAETFAVKNDLRSLSLDSNMDEVFWCASGKGPVGFQKTHTLRNAAAAYSLSNWFSTYLYSSALPYKDIKATESHDIAFFDPILLPLISTSRLTILSAGAGLSRVEKARIVAERADARELLDVCVAPMEQRVQLRKPNCSRCWKCGRTLITLEALGKLEDFAAVFDLEIYRAERPRLLAQLVQKAASGDAVASDALAFARAQGIRTSWRSSAAARFAGRIRNDIRRRVRAVSKGTADKQGSR